MTWSDGLPRSELPGTGSRPTPPAQPELGVLISAGAGEPDRLILLHRPAAGRVHLREWSTHNWSGAPDERDITVAEALAIFQGAYDARRRMSVSLKGVQAWLAGRPA
ncbi:MAG TPA: hypothetical protein VIQ74_15440 [Gemmatimonadaceae bacterium]|jgi:hypothetical protein